MACFGPGVTRAPPTAFHPEAIPPCRSCRHQPPAHPNGRRSDGRPPAPSGCLPGDGKEDRPCHRHPCPCRPPFGRAGAGRCDRRPMHPVRARRPGLPLCRGGRRRQDRHGPWPRQDTCPARPWARACRLAGDGSPPRRGTLVARHRPQADCRRPGPDRVGGGRRGRRATPSAASARRPCPTISWPFPVPSPARYAAGGLAPTRSRRWAWRDVATRPAKARPSAPPSCCGTSRPHRRRQCAPSIPAGRCEHGVQRGIRRPRHPPWPEGELAAILAARAHQRLRRRHGGDRADRGAADRRRVIPYRQLGRHPVLHHQLRRGRRSRTRSRASWPTAGFGLSVERTAILRAVHPMVWSLGQIFTGLLNDR
ncbi:hypothetical protein SAMN04244548_03018 [Paracoccus pantotrophus]|nr:hypothetical protein SAMN04244548_03018 [Paracoccus pantotrophus]